MSHEIDESRETHYQQSQRRPTAHPIIIYLVLKRTEEEEEEDGAYSFDHFAYYVDHLTQFHSLSVGLIYSSPAQSVDLPSIDRGKTTLVFCD